MRTLVAMSLAALLLAGCASIPTQSVANQSMAAWRGKTVAVTSRPRASMLMMTAGKAAFGLIGVAAAVSAGNDIVKRDNIPDPAQQVAHDLLQIAEKQYGIVPASLAPVRVDTRNIADLASAARGADLLIDVESTGQGINYFASDWSHYWLQSGLILRVIDVHTATVVGQAVCGQNTLHQPNPPSRKDLLANDGQVLKSMLAAQSDACRDQFANTVLRVGVPAGAPATGAPQGASAGQGAAQSSK